MQFKVIDDKVVAKERKNEFEIARILRFRYRTRYFTDLAIIGSKMFKVGLEMYGHMPYNRT
jgi:hypothetical protein